MLLFYVKIPFLFYFYEDFLSFSLFWLKDYFFTFFRFFFSNLLDLIGISSSFDSIVGIIDDKFKLLSLFFRAGFILKASESSSISQNNPYVGF